MKRTLLTLLIFVIGIRSISAHDIYLEAESFYDRGGWVIDTQSIPTMGSPYLMAHGMGCPVLDAYTTVYVEKSSRYKVWVRTRDWTRSFGSNASAGKFEILFDGNSTDVILGTEGIDWHWQEAGITALEAGGHRIQLHDLTGFNGRIDAVYLTNDSKIVPPNDIESLRRFRRSKLGFPEEPAVKDHYDLVVVGGGIAGCCTAVSAARLGCKVALIQNRSVLGGNNSSEIRVGLNGNINMEPYSHLGSLIDEFGYVGYWNQVEVKQDPYSKRSCQIRHLFEKYPDNAIHSGGPASAYRDDKKERLVRSEENIDLYLNTHVFDAKTEKNKITEVIALDVFTGEEMIFKAPFFADCTGDATVGYLAGADYHVGRESRAETGEPHAPEVADSLVMGASVQWYADDIATSNYPFPEVPWAIKFNEKTCSMTDRGNWYWEVGLTDDQVDDIEYIRDHAFRSIYGNWSYVKNHCAEKKMFAAKKLVWVGYIAGKRESRRLMGDHLLTENDIMNHVEYEDATFTTTWPIDLHYPRKVDGIDKDEDAFYAVSKQIPIKPYAVPYRCLYSRNITNLFMAGRDISVSHIALGTTRVMRTCGMAGEVVGMAVSICKTHDALPRDIYATYLDELKNLMEQGVGTSGFPDDGRL